MAKILFDAQHQIEIPTLLLQNRNFDTIGVIRDATNLTYKEHFNGANELSFTVYQESNGKENSLWDSIVDFKVLHIPEFQEWFEISVSTTSEDTSTKSVTARSLCESELGQMILRNLEINTEADILNPSYDKKFPTVFYRDPDAFDSGLYDWSDEKYAKYTPEDKKKLLRSSSLLHRILDKAPHYSIDSVDESLRNLQREFSISETDIYGELTGEIAEEFNCLFLFDAKHRTVSAHDLYRTCNTCHYRGSFSKECPKCGKTDISEPYGKDTTILISTENLASQISLETNSDSLKNCFYVEGGDDMINAAIRSCNPNGSQYLYYFSEETKKDMPKKLADALKTYDESYAKYNSTETDFSFNPDIVTNYNSVVKYVNDRFPGKKTISGDTLPLYQALDNPLKGYPATTAALYEVIDLYHFIKSGMLPTINIDGLDIDSSLKSILTGFANGFPIKNDNGTIINYFKNEISIQDHTTVIQSIVERTIENTAKLFYSTAYYELEVKTNSYTKAAITGTTTTNGIWKGVFTITSLTETDPDTKALLSKSSEEITITISDNAQLFIEQSIYRAVSQKDVMKDKQIASLQLDTVAFKERLQFYSLDELKNLCDSFRMCQSVIQDAAIENKALHDKYYNFYTSRIKLIAGDKTQEGEIPKRTKQLQAIESVYYFDSSLPLNKAASGALYELRKEVNDSLSKLEESFGEDMQKLFYSYRREDSYSNQNYISDGLTNAEIITRAEKLLETATQELYKAAHPQCSLTATMNNLMTMKEFQPLVDSFAVGNWIWVKMEDNINKLRLLSYQINFDDLQTIDVEFSTVEKLWNGNSDINSILNAASSMATSYQGLVQQVDKTSAANAYVSDWLDNGFTATQTKFANAYNQSLVIDRNGLLARSYDDIRDVYNPYQLKIVNNGLYTTSDNWDTIDTGVGRISYTDPETGTSVDTYGVIAKAVVGKLFLGEKLGIYSVGENGAVSMKFNGNGLKIENELSAVTINPNDNSNIFKITKKTTSSPEEKIFFIDNQGNLNLTGKVNGCSFNGGSISIGNGNFTVDSKGVLNAKGATISGTLQAATGTFSGQLLSATGTFSGELKAATGSFSGELKAATGSFSGELKAATGSFSGELHAHNKIFLKVPQYNNSDFAIVEAKGTGMSGCIEEVTTTFYAWGNTPLLSCSTESGILSLAPTDGLDVNIGYGAICISNFESGYMVINRDLYIGKKTEISGGLALKSGAFTSASLLRFTNNKGVYGANTSGTDISLIKINNSNNVHVGADNYNTYIHGPNGSIALLSDRFRAETDDNKYCGDSAHRWKCLYAVKGTVNTSDRNYKKNIRDIPDIFEDLFLNLRPKIFQFLDGDRNHIGAISQEVEETMKKLGITEKDFAGFCRDIKMKDIIDPNTGDSAGQEPILDADGNPEYIYSLRYQEFIFLLVEMVQRLYGRVAALENEIK